MLRLITTCIFLAVGTSFVDAAQDSDSGIQSGPNAVKDIFMAPQIQLPAHMDAPVEFTSSTGLASSSAQDEPPALVDESESEEEMKVCSGMRCQPYGLKHPERGFHQREWKNRNDSMRLCKLCRERGYNRPFDTPTAGSPAQRYRKRHRDSSMNDSSAAKRMRISSSSEQLTETRKERRRRQKREKRKNKRTAQLRLECEARKVINATKLARQRSLVEENSRRSSGSYKQTKAQISAELTRFETITGDDTVDETALARDVRGYCANHLSKVDASNEGTLSVLYHMAQNIVKRIVRKDLRVREDKRNQKLAGCLAFICKARVLVAVICARKEFEDTKARGHCLQICAAYRCWEACVNNPGASETQQMLVDYARGRVDDILINHPGVDLDEVVSWSLAGQKRATKGFLNANLAKY